MGIEEGTCWDEHWVLYGNQFDNKFHTKKKRKKKINSFVDTISSRSVHLFILPFLNLFIEQTLCAKPRVNH